LGATWRNKRARSGLAKKPPKSKHILDFLHPRGITATMSGSLLQARRRSEETNYNANANQEETTVDVEGWCVSLDVTEDEMVEVLKSSKCYGGAETKKTLLRAIVEHRDALIARLKSCCSHLEQSFDLNMPKKKSDVNKLLVPDVVKKLFQAKVVLDQYLEAEEVTKTRLVLAIEALLVEINKMRKEAHDTVKDTKEDSLQNQIIKLGQLQKNRMFLVNGSLPLDEAHRKCAFCKHPNVDEPSSNRTVGETNLLQLAEHNV
jgi:hypothetical protein